MMSGDFIFHHAKNKIKQFQDFFGNGGLVLEMKFEMTARACREILEIDAKGEDDFDGALLDKIVLEAVKSTFDDYVAKMEAD